MAGLVVLGARAAGLFEFGDGFEDDAFDVVHEWDLAVGSVTEVLFDYEAFKFLNHLLQCQGLGR